MRRILIVLTEHDRWDWKAQAYLTEGQQPFVERRETSRAEALGGVVGYLLDVEGEELHLKIERR